MDVERIIDEIEQIQEMFEAPDIRPLSANDVTAANRKHDEMLAHSPWFKLWQHYGICCRPESPVIQLPEQLRSLVEFLSVRAAEGIEKRNNGICFLPRGRRLEHRDLFLPTTNAEACVDRWRSMLNRS